MSVFEKHPAIALAAGALCLASVTASGLMALHAAGTPMVLAREPAPAVAEAASPVAISAVLTDSPASSALTGLLEEPPGKWKADGPLQQGVALPVPYSCDAGAAPTVALARSFRADEEDVQVITAAYTAGLGAEAMDILLDNAVECAGSSIGVSGEDLDSPGVQAHRAYTAKSGHETVQVLTFRRGDVLTFMVAEADAPLQKLGQALDKKLAGALKDVCVDQESDAADAARSPWSATGYEPFTVADTVAVRTVPLPRAPADADYEAVAMPAPALEIKAAKPAADPAYPVWPPMPDKREVPKPPKSPDAEPVTSAKVKLLAEDTTGPGCGWNFTGMAPVPFDADATAAANQERIRAAEDKLADGVEAWQQSVLDYWAGYDQYRTKVQDYKDYAAEVATVNKAWDKIAAQWDDYWGEYAVYQQALAERSAFFTRQDNARAEYRNALAQCEADNRNAEQEYQEALEEAEKNKDDEDEKESEPPASPEPVDCESAVGVPAILDWAPPAEPVAPATPADPRPKDQR